MRLNRPARDTDGFMEQARAHGIAGDSVGNGGAQRRILLTADAESTAALVAEVFGRALREAVAARGSAALVWSGGRLLAALTDRPQALSGDSHDWSHAHLFAADDGWGSDAAAALARLPLPRENLHRPAAAASAGTAAAVRYEQILRAHFRLPAGGLPRFDLVLLEVGVDGSTGGLLPHAAALDETGRLVVSDFARGSHRVSLTLPVINHARAVALVATGAGVAPALAEAFAGPQHRPCTPLDMIRPTSGELILIADHPAASRLPLVIDGGARRCAVAIHA